MNLTNIHTDQQGNIVLPITLSKEEFVTLKAAILDIPMMTMLAENATVQQVNSAYFIGSMFRDIYEFEADKVIKKLQKRARKLHVRPQ